MSAARRLSGRLAPLALVFLTGLWGTLAVAEVTATIDRSEIERNESFTFKITVDAPTGEKPEEPETSVLEADFHIIERSDLTNTMIVNGQISRTRTWTYVMMARRTGDLVIPPVTVGRERSNPIPITVAPQAAAQPGRSDVFVTAEVDQDEAYVQAQVLYSVKVYRAVATRQPRLGEPELDGVDTLLEVIGDERNYESIIGGKSYNVVERRYALFPQESGELSIAPARFEARVLRDGRITGRKIFQSDPVSMNVKAIPPPPDEYPDAAWFPAKSVELGETWSREPDSLPAGEPITRHVTVTAAGQLSTQIPALDIAEPDRVKVYPDKPELRVSADPSGVLAARKDQYAMIGIEAGNVHLPAVDLPWWDIDAEEWQLASLPARTIRILPPADALPEPAVAVMPDALETAQGAEAAPGTFWRNVSVAIGAAWAGTLALWWATTRRSGRRDTARAPTPPPVHRQQARFIKSARRAAVAGDIGEVRDALLEWGRLQWPERAPRSIGELAMRVDEPLAGELRALGRASYGPGGDSWDGSALARALRSAPVSPRRGESGAGSALPPLMPRT